MQPKTPGLLWDIEDSARFIVESTTGIPFESYLGNRQLRLAVERSFEIIGEACRRLAGHDPETASRLSGLPQVIAFRNVLAHGYDEINDARVWSIIGDHLLTILAEAQALLEESGRGDS